MIIKLSRETFHKKLIEHKKEKSKGKNIEYDIIPRYMKSLRKMKLPLYLPYSKSELSIYIPNDYWILLLYDNVYKLSLKVKDKTDTKNKYNFYNTYIY